MVPTKEEETKLSSYKGNINELGSAEKFVKAMLRVPFAFQRADVMLYRETFEDEVVHLRNSFSMLEVTLKTRNKTSHYPYLYHQLSLISAFFLSGGLQGTAIKQAVLEVT